MRDGPGLWGEPFFQVFRLRPGRPDEFWGNIDNALEQQVKIIENKKLVFTNTLGPNFRPSENPFFTAVITLEPHGTGTKYSALAMHKDEATRQSHEDMGFHVGWGMSLDQLVELAKQM
jgi:uncharacterized protein YndB with AHSA1/START domain